METGRMVHKYETKYGVAETSDEDEGAVLTDRSSDGGDGLMVVERRLSVAADSSSGRSSCVGDLADDVSPFAWVSPAAARALRQPAAAERQREWLDDPNEDAPLATAVAVYISCAVVLLVGYVRDWLRRHRFETVKAAQERPQQKHFVPLNHGFDGLYRDSIYRAGCDVIGRTVCSNPGAEIVVKDRTSDDNQWSFRYPGTYSKLLNLGSYNYLGFSENEGACARRSAAAIDSAGVAFGSSANEFGSHTMHRRLERTVAEFVGTEDAVAFAMGFATNSMNLCCFASKGSLILSDSLNHASVVLGCRMSGAQISTFKHADLHDLERQLREAIVKGSSTNGRPYKNMLIVVEGIYSMEGTIVNLPRLVELKNKYGAFLFLDEAHSIGALGPRGRGVCDYWAVDPRQVDVLMGTFSKSFGSAGGYIAGSKTLIDFVRAHSHTVYSPTMAPAMAMQVIASMEVIMGLDGTGQGLRRVETIARNTAYVRRRLRAMGLLVYGHADSPVVPFITFYPSKVVCVSRELMARGLAVVAVGFPACPVTKARVRLCMSAAHSRQQLDRALDLINEVADLTGCKYGKPATDAELIEY